MNIWVGVLLGAAIFVGFVYLGLIAWCEYRMIFPKSEEAP